MGGDWACKYNAWLVEPSGSAISEASDSRQREFISKITNKPKYYLNLYTANNANKTAAGIRRQSMAL